MKKIVVFSLCLICFWLCGCERKISNVTAVTTGISFTAEMLLDGIEYKYNTKIMQDGSIEMAATEPQNIKDLIISISNSKVKIRYKELEYTTNIGELPGGVITDFLYDVFSDINLNKREVTVKEDEFYINGSTEKYNYTVLLGQSGLPLKITDKSGIDVTIKNASIMEK